MNAMDVIPYEENSFYIFDRGYNDFKPVKWTRRFPPGSGIFSDAIGYMNSEKTRFKYPEKIRPHHLLGRRAETRFIIFTNTMDISPIITTELYRNRWQILLFFKWLKQHLKIKKFWGESENAVRVQICIAVTAYCMMAIVQ